MSTMTDQYIRNSAELVTEYIVGLEEMGGTGAPPMTNAVELLQDVLLYGQMTRWNRPLDVGTLEYLVAHIN